MSHELVPAPAPANIPLPLFALTPKAAKRVLEFFTVQINNEHTCKAYFFTLARVLLRHASHPNYARSIR
jgi:predicted membrane-bound mannosyltransferase